MFSPAFLSGQTTCTVWPTACIACSKTKISYSSLNSPTSIRIFLPGIGLLLVLSAIVVDPVPIGRVPVQIQNGSKIEGA